MAVLTNAYQYIGRSSAVGCAAGWNYYILLYAKTSGSTATGRHTVTVRMRLACTSDATFYGYGTAGSVTVAGSTAVSWSGAACPGADWSASAPITEGGVYYYRHTDLAEAAVDVDTGWGKAKDITITASWGRVESVDPVPVWLPYYKTYANAGIGVTLPAIAGASAITGISDVTLGNRCNVSWVPLGDALYYRLEFSLGDWSRTTEVIHPDTAGPYTYTGFVLPLEAAYQLPDSPTGTMTAALYTYSDSGGTVRLGSPDSAAFTVTVPLSAGPAVSITALTPVSSLPAPFDSLFIKGKSRVKAALSAAGQYGASIAASSFTVEGRRYADTSDYLTSAGELTVRAEVTDSRGYSGSSTSVITVRDYAAPTVQVGVCARCGETGELSDSGTRLKLQAAGAYFPLDGANSARLWYRWKLATAADSGFSDPVTLAEGVSFEGVVPGVEFNRQASYVVRIGITDDLGETAAATFTVLTERIYWHRGADFLALGMYSQNGGLECGWPARFYGGVWVGDVPLEDYIQNLISGG